MYRCDIFEVDYIPYYDMPGFMASNMDTGQVVNIGMCCPANIGKKPPNVGDMFFIESYNYRVVKVTKLGAL